MQPLRTSALAAALAVSIALTAHSEPQPLTLEDVHRRVIEAHDNLKSYEFTQFDSGYDTFTKKRRRDMTKAYSKDAERLKQAAPDVTEKTKLVEGTYLVRFMKPYLIRMKLVQSDFVPSIVHGTTVTYRPDRNPDTWTARVKYLPFVPFNRSVEKNDPGGFFGMGWTVPIMLMDVYAKLAETKLLKTEKFTERKCRVVAFAFRFGKNEEITLPPQDFRRWNIPKQVDKYIAQDLSGIKDERPSKILYWIDAENFLILKTERYNDGKLHWTTEYRDIETNHLTEKDF